MKTFRPLLLFAALLLIVGLACNATGGGGDAPAQPEQPEQPAQQPTKEEAQPTEAPATEAPATEAPATAAPATEAPADAQPFFREEFNPDVNLGDWEYFTLGSGTDKDLVIEQEDDHLLFDLGDEDLYVYFMYTAFTYDNVSLTMSAENLGRNNNNVSLVCRMNEDGTQWYEFSVESGGLWYLYAVDGGYNTIANGGTNALKQGKEVNEYQLVCDGDDITMYVNGDEIKTVTDTRYGFSEGQVGINISSLNVLPITVNVDWIDISEP
jgi:hypothetical protein